MKFVSLVSSGIDSPVATYLISKKAKEIIFIHSDNKPFTDDREINNFFTITKHLKKIIHSKIKVFIVPHGLTLDYYKKNCLDRLTCVFCKRMMVRYAEKIAEKEEADAIIMGDSLGQVASQTIQNIKIVDSAVKIPILRPLIGFDKEDIVNIARKIGTYELSILPSAGCTSVPNKPATRVKLEDILNEEKKLNIEKIVKEAVDNSEVIVL
ncbi:MAG: 7-cyano-7-deazaguanine synthase [Candidatus Thermoplasmatota archaeon]|jgi:thiamine biosynthesis protein ThiI|nr:7-cyano-7-deazaguanine synthase [Candidatus Thermoplasmatota archaeon]